MAILGVRNQAFIDVSPFIDLERLASMRMDLLAAISKSRLFLSEAGSRLHPQETTLDHRQIVKSPELFDPKLVALREKVEKEGGREPSIRFAQLAMGAYSPFLNCPLRISDDFPTRGMADRCHWLPEQVANFPKEFLGFIESLPFKGGVGRVTFFIRQPYCRVPFHRDDDVSSPGIEFIWFHIIGRPRVEIIDETGTEKYTCPSNAVFFNDRDYHGVPADERASVSLRVDGVFSDEFREQIYSQLG